MEETIKSVLANLKISALNEMQNAVIKASSKSGDVILLSPTGSGKTLGFLLPVLSQLKQDKKGVQALILVPSRELAIQIETVFKQMGTGFKINCCYGGHSTRIEKNNLEHPPALLVGTPGRIAYHIRNTNFDVSTVNMLVLDEFDKSLEFGFKEDMSAIIYDLKNLNKRMLTSATNMEEIPAFTGVKDPVQINFLGKVPSRPAGLKLKIVKGKDKLDVLFSLICKYGDKATLVFCNHRDAVERISQLLKDKGLSHDIFHGGMEQDDRERALIKFRNGSHRILITTDLASRGLDIPEIEIVIHYQLPTTEDSFIHRNGRTARMNAKGTSYLVLSDTDHVPTFIKETPEFEELEENYPLPENTPWSTLYIAAGKKDKINKMDIVGMLLQKGKLQKDELGLIEVLDKSAYAAVRRDKINKVVSLVREEKIKGRKIKMAVSE
ncbi:MAG: box helicase [Bacteroidota bacterium]|jgi:ATP-independent RNA helicase DbpA|nr:box helicase [Bacteroidota bacterium]